jgi:dienelactone hydrolase
MLFLILHRGRRLGLVVLGAVIGLLVAGLVMAAVGHAQARPVDRAAASHTFAYLRGTDTLAVETISLGADTIRGVLSMRGAGRIEWDQAHRARTPLQLTIRAFAPADTGRVPAQVAVFQLRGDSMDITLTGGGRSQRVTAGTRAGAAPLVNSSVLHAVLLTDHALAAGLDTLPVFLTSGGQTVPATVAVRGDTVTFTAAGNPMRFRRGEGPPDEITLPAQGVRVVRSTTPIRVEVRPPSYDAPPGAPYTAEHVRIPTMAGHELAATLTRPLGVERAPVVVTISGSGPQDRDSRIAIVPDYAFFREIADTLGRRGVAVLRFDDRGVGESTGRESAARATSADVADDVRAVVSWLRAQRTIDGDRIVLAGHSEGGMVAPMVAATDPALRGVVLMAGSAYTGRRILEYQNEQSISRAPGLSDVQRDSLRRLVPGALDSLARSNPWIGFFMTHDPLVTIRDVRQPVLILQGDTDRQVTPEQADLLASVLRESGNASVTLRRFPSVNHLFLADPEGYPDRYASLRDRRVHREVLGALADWVVQVVR